MEFLETERKEEKELNIVVQVGELIFDNKWKLEMIILSFKNSKRAQKASSFHLIQFGVFDSNRLRATNKISLVSIVNRENLKNCPEKL